MRIGLAADNGTWHKNRLLAALRASGVEPVLFPQDRKAHV